MSRILKVATPSRSSLAIATGLALLMTAGSAWAADPQQATDQQATPQQPTATRSHDREAAPGSHIVKDMNPIVVFPGAVHASRDEQWTDDDASAADLPMVRDQESTKR